MRRTIICTVGLSLLTGARGDRPWKWRPGPSSGPLPERDVVASWLGQADPEIASAETNTLRLLTLGEGDRLILFPTDTPASRRCSSILAEHFRPQCREVVEDPIPDLGYSAERFNRGLRDLLDKAIQYIVCAKEDSSLPMIVASGGFKAEAAYLNLLGALTNVDVHYLHELHRNLVTLPRLPLDWNTEVVVNNRDFFEWIDGELRPSRDVESRLKANPELEPLVEDGGDGHMLLTIAGDLLFKAAKAKEGRAAMVEWPLDSHRLPGSKNKVSGLPHHRPRNWKSVVDALCKISCVIKVAYEPRAHGSESVRVLEGDQGTIGVVVGGKGDNPLPLVVETTARGEAQTQLVADAIRSELKL